MELVQKYWVYGLGFFAQFFFGIRLLAQWIQSEREGRVVSPVSFWMLSLIAALIFWVYGILQNDFVIIIGQVLTYFIYIRNIQLKNAWTTLNPSLRMLTLVAPVIAIAWMAFGNKHNWRDILENNDFSSPLVLLGTAGQLIMSIRFIYQWHYSEKRKTSILPYGFWVISAFGTFLVMIYAIFKQDKNFVWHPDPVLFFAHSLGLFIYIRNMMIHKRMPEQME